MLSGNGRHRRPRQAPALVVAAGVTGSAIAIPLLGATGAHAAGANWDQVAECETGGAWSQNAGNGYYGGLQLPQEAWERYGGLEYAASADQASRSQQIRIAEKLYADQGIAAWPTCGLLAGLGNPPGATGATDATGDGSSEESRSPEKSETPESAESSAGKTPESTTSPNVTDSSESSASPSPSESTEGSDSSPETSGSSPSPSSSPSSGSSDASSDGKDQSAKTDTTPESNPHATAEPEAADRSSGSGKHRGDSADEGGRWKGLTDSTSGRHASRDGGPGDADDGSYIVRSGDNLWAIADSLGVDGGWRALYSDNERVVGHDPDRILPGQTLTVTGESGEK
ncbi:transglycosylase family protein [Streptomyces sp. NPDC058985]|uniref:LysM peptidoglycan-binding domain-containing protein n=1 Tax=Streptomyces sp. NPDC058985 TaxID=3346684 RepID=UPI0036B8242C